MIDVQAGIEFTVNINASDDVQLASVEMYQDGVLINTWAIAGAAWSRQEAWGPYAAGESHVITIIARDAAGNASAPWQDTVRGMAAADTTPPTVSVTVTQP